MKKRRLKSLADCIRAGAWLFNAIINGEVEPAIAGRLTYLLNVQRGILQAIEQFEIEKKQITEFEERLTKVESEIAKQARGG